MLSHDQDVVHLGLRELHADANQYSVPRLQLAIVVGLRERPDSIAPVESKAKAFRENTRSRDCQNTYHGLMEPVLKDYYTR
jgi:hypothetical protein